MKKVFKGKLERDFMDCSDRELLVGQESLTEFLYDGPFYGKQVKITIEKA